MKKIDLPLYSDVTFTAFSVWILSLCVLRYYRLNLALSLVICTLLALLAGGGAWLVLYRSRRKKFLLARDREEKDKLMLHLTLSPEADNARLLAPILPENLKKEDIFLAFTMQPLSADAVALKIKERAGGRFTLLCNALSPEAAMLCKDFSIATMNGEEIYAALKEKNLLPEKYVCGERKKKTFLEKLRFGLRKKNSRPFFWSGVFLLTLSLFSFFPVYYITFGTALLITALLLRVFGYS